MQEVPCDLLAVVDVPPAHRDSTNPLPAGLTNFFEAAREQKIPVFSPENPNTPEFVNELCALTPDLFMAVGYALILKPPVLAVPKILAANFHASLLPHYRGKHPVFWTLRNSKRSAGLTVHAMDAGIDTGDIIYQVKVRTRWDDTVASLYSRIMDRSMKLVGKLVDAAEKSMIPRQPQPPGEGSYFSSISQEDFRLDWAWRAKKIRRFIMMTPWDCFTTAAGQRLTFSQAELAWNDKEGPPGKLLATGRKSCLVAVRNGALRIGQAKIEGGEEQSMAAACRQLGLKVGDVLG